jgi:hypothetical protein
MDKNITFLHPLPEKHGMAYLYLEAQILTAAASLTGPAASTAELHSKAYGDRFDDACKMVRRLLQQGLEAQGKASLSAESP